MRPHPRIDKSLLSPPSCIAISCPVPHAEVGNSSGSASVGTHLSPSFRRDPVSRIFDKNLTKKFRIFDDFLWKLGKVRPRFVEDPRWSTDILIYCKVMSLGPREKYRWVRLTSPWLRLGSGTVRFFIRVAISQAREPARYAQDTLLMMRNVYCRVVGLFFL